MKKFRNFLLRFLIFCIISILIFSLSGCYSVQSIDDLAYVVALGIDLGKNNNLELTVQLTFPIAQIVVLLLVKQHQPL